MPKGIGTYGKKRGRPPKRKGTRKGQKRKTARKAYMKTKGGAMPFQRWLDKVF